MEPGYTNLGLVLLRMGKTQESVPKFEKALSLKPSDSAAQLDLAIAYEQLGQPAKNSSCWHGSMPQLEPKSMLCRPTPQPCTPLRSRRPTSFPRRWCG